MKLPDHKCGLSIEHNQHRNYYETVEQWMVDNEWCEWQSDEDKEIAIKTDEVWTIQWYPDTPIGFYAIAAPTLEKLLQYANETE